MQKFFNRYYCVCIFFFFFFLFYIIFIIISIFSSFLSNEEIRSWPARQRRGKFFSRIFCISVFFYLLINWLSFFASSIVFHSVFLIQDYQKRRNGKIDFFFRFRSGKHFTGGFKVFFFIEVFSFLVHHHHFSCF